MKLAPLVALWNKLTGWADCLGVWIAPFGLRLLLAKEFWDSGVEKYNGQNWFADVMEKFPFPFNHVPVDISWAMSTWFELIGAIALVVGLATRFFSVSLFILTIVAIAAVHWPEQWDTLSDLAKGYAVRDEGFGNFKLPLIYLVMFIPLILQGPGRLSLDHWIKQRLAR